MSVDALLARQAGVISRRQALTAGLTREAVDHRVRLRHWRPLHPRVYLDAAHGGDDGEVAVRGAVLWAGAGAVLTGPAAAWWHGMLDRPPPSVRVTVPRRRTLRARPGTEVRRGDLAPCDVTEHRGVLVTARPLTVLDTAVDLGGGFLDRALQREVAFASVRAAHLRLGTCGSASAGRLLTAAAARSASVAARLLVRLLRDAGVRGWRPGPPVVFPAAAVVVEVDGWAGHAGPRTPVRTGWTVLRYTWHDLVDRPAEVLAGITRTVRATA